MYQVKNLFHLTASVVYSQRRRWHPTPVLLPGKSHGRRSLVGCHPWGHKESDTTEQLDFHFSLSCIGEGNGSPLQCSCLENPRDGGAWWLPSMGSHRVGHDWRDLEQQRWCILQCTRFSPPPASSSLFNLSPHNLFFFFLNFRLATLSINVLYASRMWAWLR